MHMSSFEEKQKMEGKHMITIEGAASRIITFIRRLNYLQYLTKVE